MLSAAGLNQANLADPECDDEPTLHRVVDENPEWMPGGEIWNTTAGENWNTLDSERRKRMSQAPKPPIPLAEAEALRDALVNHLGKIEEKCQALQRVADLLSAYEPCAKPEESDSQRDGKLAMLRVVTIMQAQARKAANAAPRTEEADARGAVGQLEVAISGAV